MGNELQKQCCSPVRPPCCAVTNQADKEAPLEFERMKDLGEDLLLQVPTEFVDEEKKTAKDAFAAQPDSVKISQIHPSSDSPRDPTCPETPCESTYPVLISSQMVDLPTSYFDRDVAEIKTLRADTASTNERIGKLQTFKTGATYLGQWQANARHGFGIQQWPDGYRYEGDWVQNQAEGHGKATHVDGSIFIGQWKKNMVHGIGVYYYKSKCQKHQSIVYKGQWVDDLQHGYGSSEWQDDGSLYQGQFNKGKMEGFGVYHWPDGSVYQGEWSANCINGKGCFVGKDGHEFKGQWQNACMHGTGKSSWSDGTKYEGQYAHDRKHGFGVLTLPDKRQIEGWWKEGQQPYAIVSDSC